MHSIWNAYIYLDNMGSLKNMMTFIIIQFGLSVNKRQL